MTEAALVRPRPTRMLVITAAWGSCFVAIDWGLRDSPVLWFAAFRSLLAGTVLVGVAHGQHRPRPHGLTAWSRISLLALFNVTIAFAAMFSAAASLSAGVAAVLSNAQPLLILPPAWWLFCERPRRSAGAAAAVGFIGLAITASASLGTMKGAALALIAASAITTGTLLARRMPDVDVVVVSAWHFLIGGVLLALLAFTREGAPSVSWTPRFIAILAFLALVGTAAASVLWFEEVRRAPLGSVALWTFLTPVFGLIFSAIALREYPSTREVLGIALVLAGLIGGLAWPARGPGNGNDKRSPGLADDPLDHVPHGGSPRAPVDAASTAARSPRTRIGWPASGPHQRGQCVTSSSWPRSAASTRRTCSSMARTRSGPN